MKKVVGALLIFALSTICGVAWADIKPSTTTATRDIVLVEEEEGEGEKETAEVAAAVLDVEELHKNDFSVTLTSDKEDGVYGIGDNIVLTFKSEADAYLTVLDFTSSGQILVLFPNKWVENNRVKAGEEVKIPAEGQKFAMKAGGPVGVDVVKAIATNNDVPVVDPENRELAGPFAVLKDAKNATRDILLVEDEEPEPEPGGETPSDPLRWSVASLAVMTRDPEKADAPTGFGVAVNGDWTAKAWTNGTDFLTGDLVFVKFISDKPAKLVSLVNLGASENENNLLPEGTDVSIEAGEILVLPRKDDKWKLVAASKTGKDVIKAKLAAEDGTELELSFAVTVDE
ncbi:MAG: DUF4384 domain-containing protein [Synergistaceae bacterium]|nr:DUF4384 domain-containing protein [Synergistaceae bacterium]